MEKCLFLIVGSVFLSLASSHVLPSESITDDVALEKDSKLDAQPYGLAESIRDATEDKPGQREKRFYNYFDYNNDFNVNSDLLIPFRKNIQRRHPAYNSFGNYGSQDPLDLILTKLQEIANDRTYLPPRPIPVPYPTYIPVIYVPKITCDCSSNDFNNKPRPENNKTIPDFTDRFPDMDDISQNWGPTQDNSENDYSDDEGSRPLSFTPVKLDEPLSRPPPPVEHGSVQAGLEQAPQVSPTNPLTQEKEMAQTFPDTSQDASSEVLPPNTCEKASISCCHQHTINYACFRSHGCNDLAYFRNGCTPQLLLPALKKLEMVYRQKLAIPNKKD